MVNINLNLPNNDLFNYKSGFKDYIYLISKILNVSKV